MADPLQPGAAFAGHRIEGLAGRGGRGVVYRATHIALDHVVALKVISPASGIVSITRWATASATTTADPFSTLM